MNPSATDSQLVNLLSDGLARPTEVSSSIPRYVETFSPVGRLPGEKMAFALFTPTSARGLRVLFWFLDRNQRGRGWSGPLGRGKSPVLGGLTPFG